MNKQVITIDPNGQMSGLQRKPGQGVDLTKFGAAQVVRVSEIEWDETAQKWTIRPLTTGTAIDGELVSYRQLILALRDGYEALAGLVDDAGVLDQPARFDGYDQAVAAEIAYLDALRLRGDFK